MPPALQQPQQPPPLPQHVAAAVQNANAIATAVNVFVTPIDGAYGTGFDTNNVIMFGSVAVTVVPRDLFYLVLAKFGIIPAKLIALIKALHFGCKVKIRFLGGAPIPCEDALYVDGPTMKHQMFRKKN